MAFISLIMTIYSRAFRLGMVLSIERGVVDEMSDMIVHVKSCLVWDLVSEVENGVS